MKELPGAEKLSLSWKHAIKSHQKHGQGLYQLYYGFGLLNVEPGLFPVPSHNRWNTYQRRGGSPCPPANAGTGIHDSGRPQRVAPTHG